MEWEEAGAGSEVQIGLHQEVMEEKRREAAGLISLRRSKSRNTAMINDHTALTLSHLSGHRVAPSACSV